MRHSAFLLAVSLLTMAAAIHFPDLQPFLSALPNLLEDYVPPSFQNDTAHDLLKRQGSNCPTGFNSCANLGAPGLCCMSSAVCSADFAGHVACCPSGAACTGTIAGVISSGTVNGNGSPIGGAATTTSGNGALTTQGPAPTTSFLFATSSAQSSSSNNGLVAATTQTALTTDSNTSGGGFIIAGSSTVASPGSGGRRADVPAFVHIVVRALDYLQL